MRRLAAIVVAGLLAVPAGISSAAPALDTPGGGSTQGAFTMFLNMPAGAMPRMYFGGALAFDVVDAYGFAGRTRCRIKRQGNVSSWDCTAVAVGIPIEPTDFTLDPLLREAHVAFDQGRFHQLIDWTNDAAFQPGYDTGSAGAGVGATSTAKSSGSLFGYDFSPRADDPFGLLSESASASVAVDGARLWMSPDRRVHVHVRVPAPQE